MSLSLTIEYPEVIPDILQESRAIFEKEAKMAMAVKLFEMKRISSGLAAKLVGTDRVSFLMALHEYHVPMIDETESELLEDIRNAG